MTFVSAFTQFNRGFLSGASFGLGVGISNVLSRVFFDINMSCNPFFSYTPFNSCFNGGGMFYNYDIDIMNNNRGFMPCNNSSIWNFDTTLQAPSSGIDTYGSTSFFNTLSYNLPTLTPALPSIKTEKGNKTSSKLSSNGSHIYATLSKADAEKRAKANSNLEKLSKGEGWSISENSFENDIPYARKGTGALLDKVCKEAGVTLTVTSALGTKTSPHNKGITGADSHYNENNPKLDLGGGLSDSQAKELKAKLDKTGLFSRVEVEPDGATSHLDVQFSDEAYKTV